MAENLFRPAIPPYAVFDRKAARARLGCLSRFFRSGKNPEMRAVMGNLSVREAVKHFNVSRPTLQKALAEGKVSGSKDEAGGWQIDPAELARIYPARRSASDKFPGQNDGKEKEILPTVARPDSEWSMVEKNKLTEELAMVKLELAEAKARAEERAGQIDDLKARLDAESAERRTLSARLLPPPGEQPTAKRRKLFGLF